MYIHIGAFIITQHVQCIPNRVGKSTMHSQVLLLASVPGSPFFHSINMHMTFGLILLKRVNGHMHTTVRKKGEPQNMVNILHILYLFRALYSNEVPVRSIGGGVLNSLKSLIKMYIRNCNSRTELLNRDCVCKYV